MAGSVSKVVYAGETLIDLTADTVTAAKMLTGTTAHDKAGEQITGTCNYDAYTSDATAAAAEILASKTAYVSGAKITGTMPNRGAQASTITTKAQAVTIQNGYHDGSGTVQIDSTEQAKIIPANILKGVVILGVTGTSEPSSDVTAQAKTVIPAKTAQTVLPDEGTDYLSQVTVEAIPYTQTENSAGGYTVTIGTVG